MSEESSKFNAFSIVKELILALLLAAGTFLYAVIMLLIITFVFNSMMNLSFHGILMISAAASICAFLFYVIRSLIKHRKTH